jgi:peptidoglycan hydrolase-like protein with peptidoglycan-binding domain
MNATLRLAAALTIGVFGAAAGYAGERASTTNPSGQLYAAPSQVRMVQEKLTEQGRKPGVDGIWGEKTAAEVRDYQKANALAPTGQLDTSLLSALEIGDVLEGETSSTFLDGLLRDTKVNSDEPGGLGVPLYVSPLHVAQIQHLLRAQGHYAGVVDGAWGAETARAANKFRQTNGLEANNGLDIALLRALNKQATDVPKIVSAATARTEGVPLEAGPTAIRALQRELGKKGHEAGAVDGVWGENTRQALRDFQREHDLEATGTLTLPTLAALGIDVTSKPGEKASLSSDVN